MGIKDLQEIKRFYGEHLTPVEIFNRFIFPEIKDVLHEYIWVDLYAGKGNLIFPILDYLPLSERAEFFKNHIRLFDIQEDMVNYMRNKAINVYNIPKELAFQNIQKRDNLDSFPFELRVGFYPIYHITNPPYLYVGYIKKHKNEKDYQRYLNYFQNERKKLQDLYQVALFNDLKAGISKMIYIIPTNFIYGKSGTNEIRKLLFPYYNIDRAYLIEDKIFENTGVNVGIFFFNRKECSFFEDIEFKVTKIYKNRLIEKQVVLKRKFNYRVGDEFEEYVRKNIKNNLSVSFYLMKDEVLKNKGTNKVVLLNSNKYNKSKNEYEKEVYFVNDYLYKKIKNNILWVRTIDTGSYDGRAGLYTTKELGVDGILTEKPYRTHPIQIFITPGESIEKQLELKYKFNSRLEELRKLTDSGFMTTYKYSENSEYIRKYLGLIQVKKLINTIEI